MHKHWTVTIFREGRNFDLWHVSHFIAGILFAGLVHFFDINLYLGFGVSFALMVGWELFEINLGIKETKFNMYFDVIFSVISFWMTIYSDHLVENYLDSEAFKDLFIILFAIYAIMGIWGFWAAKIRNRVKRKKD